MAAKNRLAAEREAQETMERLQRQEEESTSGFETSDALETLLTEHGIASGDAKVHVYLIEPDSGDEPKIWSGLPEDYDIDALAKKFGSGKYRLKIYARTEAGNYGIRANKVIPYRLTPEEDARLRGLRDGSLKPDSGQNNMSVEAIVAAVKAAMPPPVAPANPVGAMREMAEIVRLMLPQQQAQPAINPLEVFRMAAELTRNNSGGDDPIDRGANATTSDIFLKLIDKFAPMFEKTITANMQGAQAGNAALPNAQAQAGAVPNEQEEAMLRLRMGLQFLVAQAVNGNEPDTYADVILDNVPEPELRAMMGQQDWLARLASFAPEVNKHVTWFTKLRESVLEALDAPEEPETPVDK